MTATASRLAGDWETIDVVECLALPDYVGSRHESRFLVTRRNPQRDSRNVSLGGGFHWFCRRLQLLERVEAPVE